jgi:hypothetical protein
VEYGRYFQYGMWASAVTFKRIVTARLPKQHFP